MVSLAKELICAVFSRQRLVWCSIIELLLYSGYQSVAVAKIVGWCFLIIEVISKRAGAISVAMVSIRLFVCFIVFFLAGFFEREGTQVVYRG